MKEQFIRFNNDYSEGALPEIISKFVETNMVQTAGYGEDPYCEHARKLIQNTFNVHNADVHFLVGGTQANLTVIAAALRPHQAVICAESGHINVHETGAIEACGHKVIGLPHQDGIITAGQVDRYVKDHYNDETHEHITQPKLVYISQPTELGTLYSKSELQALKNTCEAHDLILFIDGARLGYGFTSDANDIEIEAYGALSDVFTIGGTKLGALFGEAVVINRSDLKKDFRYIMKQKGGMLAKGRLLGLQFAAFFEGKLYFDASRHANVMANLIRDALVERGYKAFVDSPTNQLFFIIPDDILKMISRKFTYAYIERVSDKESAIRFCTSWATKAEDVETLIAFIKQLP